MSANNNNSNNQRPRLSEDTESSSGESGILNERVLILVFEFLKWDIHSLCQTASVSRRLRAISKRVLWKNLCLYRAPRMVGTLTNSLSPTARIGGGWAALAKLLYFCCGCQSTRHFPLNGQLPGHFVHATRFSKTSGKSFLPKKCRGDLLYVSDPCEHPPTGAGEDDLGIYRGVFRGFTRSRTRAFLISRQVGLEEGIRCPYCRVRVWSMTAARLVPKSAAKRLGSDGGLEYFVCLNGHFFGACWLVPLSSEEEEDDDEELELDGDGGGHEIR